MQIEQILINFNGIAENRGWEHLHSPKNLAAAICVEAGELLEQFQWLSEEQSFLTGDGQQKAAEEIADIAIYLIALSDKLGVDFESIIKAKQKKNNQKVFGKNECS